eukprot:Skav211543  [mRNA]  locus=scaffold352:513676:513915:- [translate_table: standard]
MGSTCTTKEELKEFRQVLDAVPAVPAVDFSRVISALSLEVPRNPRFLLSLAAREDPLAPRNFATRASDSSSASSPAAQQ